MLLYGAKGLACEFKPSLCLQSSTCIAFLFSQSFFPFPFSQAMSEVVKTTGANVVHIFQSSLHHIGVREMCGVEMQ